MNWDELFRIVDESEEIPPAERDEWIREQCKGDDRLLREVLGVLDAKSKVGDSFMGTRLPKASIALGAGLEGKQFGDFVLEEELSRGGMGVVYRGRQSGLERTVAIKILPHFQRSQPEVLERFRRESEAASRVQHPHAVPVLAAGETEGIAWYAMPLVDGHDLSREIGYQKEGRNLRIWPAFGEGDYVPKVVEQVAGVADALDHIHKQGIVHRDIKPRNLLLNPDGQMFVVDFGLAKVQSLGTLTSTGAVQGTPHYMSPEQAQALNSPIDHRTDVYSLSVVLFELLALKKPVEGDSVDVILGRIASGTVLSLRKLNSRAPRDLVTICEKGMAHRPEHRYQSAGEFAADLHRFRRMEAILAKPAPLHRKLQTFVRTNRRLVASLAVLLGVLVAWIVASKYEAHASQERQYTVAFSAILEDNPSHQDWVRAQQNAAQLEAQGSPSEEIQALYEQAKSKLDAEAKARRSQIKDLFDKGKGMEKFSVMDDEWSVPRDRRAFIQAVREAQQASLIFTADEDLSELASADAILPTVSISLHHSSHAEALAVGTGSVRAALQNPLSGLYSPWVELGKLPVVDVPIEEGDWRFLVDVPGVGFGEYDRFIELETDDIVIEARILKTEDVLEGMVLIGVNNRMLPNREPDNDEVTEYYAALFEPYTIPNFHVDAAAISNRQFLEYQKATGAPVPIHWSACFEGNQFSGNWQDLPIGNLGERWLDLPVVGLSAPASKACAEYFGMRLLGQHESNLATRGWDWNVYPWGNGPMPEGYKANLLAEGTPSLPWDPILRFTAIYSRLLPVREPEYNQAPFGLFHAYGNVSTITWGPVVELIGEKAVPSKTARMSSGVSAFEIHRGYRFGNHTAASIMETGVNTTRGLRCAKSVNPNSQ